MDFEAVKAVASAITPVPGGVGPMTVAMLMVNTAKAARSHFADLRYPFMLIRKLFYESLRRMQHQAVICERARPISAMGNQAGLLEHIVSGRLECCVSTTGFKTDSLYVITCDLE